MQYSLYIFLSCIFLFGCVPESKLLNKTYVAESEECLKIDTVYFIMPIVYIRDKYIFFSYFDSMRINSATKQIPIKLKRKFEEYGVVVIYPNKADSYVKNTTIHIAKGAMTKDFSIIFNPKYRYFATYNQIGYERSNFEKAIYNFPFYFLDILSLNYLKIRWNEGYSKANLIIYDSKKKKTIFSSVNSRYFDPGDSISINKHIEILLGANESKFKK